MAPTPAAFFLPREDKFLATELTRGPWSSEFQHAGPPSALMAREIERTLADAPMAVARLTMELMKPIPIAALSVRTQVVRSGRKVQWLSAELLDESSTLLARAHALCIRTTELSLPVSGDPVSDPVRSPEESPPFEFPFFQAPAGYHTAMECRLARGVFGRGPVAMWMRMRVPVLPGEAVSPLQRVMAAADSGNGVSMVLDPQKFTFVNPDLTVYLHRPPAGEWVCLDARTIPQPHGIGLSDTRLLDERGPIGRSVQSLVVEQRAPRPAAGPR